MNEMLETIKKLRENVIENGLHFQNIVDTITSELGKNFRVDLNFSKVSSELAETNSITIEFYTEQLNSITLDKVKNALSAYKYSFSGKGVTFWFTENTKSKPIEYTLPERWRLY